MRWGIVAAALLLAGCSSAEADVGLIEDEIADGLVEQVNARGVTVDCPDSIAWETGGEFHCFAEDRAGRSSRVTVHMENDEGEWSWVVG